SDNVRFVATVTDTAGQAQTRAATRPVSASPFKLDVLPEAGALVANVPNVIHVLARRIDGEPLANTRLRIDAEGARLEAVTDEQGAARIELLPAQGGKHLSITALDAGGMELFRRRADLRTGAADFIVRPSKSVYKAGETMRVTVLGTGTVYLDVLRAGQTVLTSAVTPKDGKGELALDLPPDLVGTLRLAAYRLGADATAARVERLVQVAPADGLTVKAELDREEYRPGGSATLRLSLLDKRGRPVAGAVSLVAVDEAVFALQEQRPGMEKVFFALEQELLKPVYSLYPWTPEEKPSPRRDEAIFAAGSRSEKSGIHTLAGRTFPEKEKRMSELRGERLRQVRTGWSTVLVLSLLVGFAGMWLWLPIRVMLILTGALGCMVALPALALLIMAATGAKFSPGITIFDDSGGMALAKGERMKDKAAPGGRGAFPPEAMPPRVAVGMAAGGAEPPRLRQEFPETLLWRPEFVSDDRGEFPPLSFPVADSITTYRLAASAVDASGRLGATTRPLKVFQPFFADMDLPAFLTRGDEVSVPVVVYSYLGASQTVKLALEAGDGFQLLGPAEQAVELGKNEVRSVRFPVRVVKAGRHKLKVTARAGTVADALERTVQADPGGRRIEDTRNGSLDKPASLVFDVPAGAIEGSVRASVKLYPSAFSQLVEGLEGLFRLPTGCFEQTSSTLYPNVLALAYLKRTGTPAPAVEAKARQYIHLGYQRLLTFEVPGGGFDWYGRPPGDVRLTAYGLMEFEDMAKVHEVDPALIERTRAWLLAKQQQDGSWGDPDHTAYVAWAVFAGGKSAERSAATKRFLLAQKTDDPHSLALACLALAAIDPALPELGERLDALSKLRKEEGGKASWQRSGRTLFHGRGHGGAAETTALAAQAFLAAKRPGEARAALRWLADAKDSSGTWHSTQATVQALRALVAGASAPAQDAERVVEVAVNGKTETITIRADKSEVMKVVPLELKPGR
ncbi:MAG: hypothetical protein K2W96_01685, partial [Gemmataceae bacterium]|nr:hypothetical protein [Gemmataceae bacterium]